MSKHDIESFTLHADDGVRIDAALYASTRPSDTAVVLAHGFSGTWRSQRTRHIAGMFRSQASVLAFDFRGHGRSGGVSTVGDLEILDVHAAVAFLRRHGYARIALVGFSMGAAVTVRYAGIYGDIDAIAAVSGPAHWYYKGTPHMRMLHRAVEWPLGRMVSRLALRTRISNGGWADVPKTPVELAANISPIPLLIMHGDQDPYFPLRHAFAIAEAAAEPKTLWVVPGMGHAESGMTPQLTRRLRTWVIDCLEHEDVSPVA
ncbi:MAG TPA: lysophospholipase [Candidatus Stackebrandtia faecavium]|nr:lysophospholipase [Candidatus Stackebrandtia faecavium]